MVHIKDEGSHFDAPLDVVWRYLQAPEHGPAHKGHRNTKMEMAGENVMVIDEEQDMGGKWVKTKTKITTLPPVGMAIELLEGPMAGTKFFNFYSAKGNKTEVTVVGEFVSKAMPPAQIEPAARGFLEMIFNEDTAAIRAFSAKK
jgi:hypothetical protein